MKVCICGSGKIYMYEKVNRRSLAVRFCRNLLPLRFRVGGSQVDLSYVEIEF